MAINFNFNAADYEEKAVFQPIPVGDYRLRIEEVEEKKASTGKDMYKIKFSVSGQSSSIWYYLVLDDSNEKMTNQKLGQFWESFNIPFSTFDSTKWVGKIGAGRIKHEPYNGEEKSVIHYFHNQKKQETLPVWIEPKNTSTASTTANTAPAEYYGTPPEPSSSDLSELL